MPSARDIRPSAGRRCAYCGHELRSDVYRSDARYCSNTCRADASCIRRLLDGRVVKGYSTLSDFAEKRRLRHIATTALSHASGERQGTNTAEWSDRHGEAL